jgi:hypothetical protein
MPGYLFGADILTQENVDQLYHCGRHFNTFRSCKTWGQNRLMGLACSMPIMTGIAPDLAADL